MGEDWSDVQNELNSGGNFFRTNTIPVGQSVDIEVQRYAQWTNTKYPIKDKEGKPIKNAAGLAYTWRFFLKGGQVWDVNNANRKVLLQGLHPDGSKDTVPGRFKVTNIGSVINKKPAVKVEFLGSVPEEVRF